MTSIIQDNWEECYLCGGVATEEHHVFNGPDRKAADKYGLTVHLCPHCHRTAPYAAHKDINTKRMLQQIGQTAFERRHGHEEFMRIFGRNYL